MPTERWNRLKEFFESAIALDKREREAYLDSVCAGDSQLRRELALLAEMDSKAREFLSEPAPVPLDLAAAPGKPPQPDSSSAAPARYHSICTTTGAR